MYKYILAATDEKIINSHDKKLLLDAPTLFDAGLNEKCDYVVGVTADKELRLKRVVERDGIDCQALVETGEIPIFEKYDNYIPYDLLRKAYAADKLRADEAEEQIRYIFEEFN